MKAKQFTVTKMPSKTRRNAPSVGAKMENLSEEELSAVTQGLKPFLQGLRRTSGPTQHEENDADIKQHTKIGHG